MAVTVTEVAEIVDDEDFDPVLEPKLSAEIVRDLRGACRRLKKLIANQRTKHLAAYYEVGELIRETLDQFSANEIEFYGRRMVLHLAKAAEIDTTTLRNCLRLVDKWGQEEFSSIVAHERIGWGHIVLLLSLNTKQERADFAAKVQTEGWTAVDLASAITTHYGSRRAGSGRRPALPKSVPQALGRLLRMAMQTHNTMSEALFCKDFDLAAELERVPVTSLLREQLESAITAMQQLSADLSNAAPRLDKLLQMFDLSLAAGTIQQATVEKETKL